MKHARTIAVLLSAAASFAHAQTTEPAIPFAPFAPLDVEITEIGGNVRVRSGPDQPWQPAAVGMKLDEGWDIQTSLRSFVKYKISDDQVVTVDRISTTRINRATLQNGIAKTDIGMKYGRVKYEIESAGREHDAVVRAGGTTLAVRGTVFELYDQPPFTTQVVSYDGRVQVRDARRQTRIGGRRAGTVRLAGDKNSAAETALATASFDPIINNARTPAEDRLIQQVINAGGIVSVDRPGAVPVVRGGTPLQFSETNAADLPGAGINFVLNWTGDSDLSLSVALPKFSEIIAPITSLNRGQTGGITAFDHRGGSNGGFEIVFYGPGFPGSTATEPVGGFVTLPGPTVTDPVSGISRPTIQLLNGLDGGETYVTEVNFISGASGSYTLQTFTVDPSTSQQVLVAAQFGDYAFDPSGQLSVTKQDVIYRPPPGLPPTSSARVASTGRTMTAREFASVAAQVSIPSRDTAVRKRKR